MVRIEGTEGTEKQYHGGHDSVGWEIHILLMVKPPGFDAQNTKKTVHPRLEVGLSD